MSHYRKGTNRTYNRQHALSCDECDGPLPPSWDERIAFAELIAAAVRAKETGDVSGLPDRIDAQLRYPEIVANVTFS